MQALIHFAIKLLEVLFAIGIIGSALVVVLTSIEDVIEIFTPDESPQPRPSSETHAVAAD